ncbi:MAG: UDP-N-acetylmuramate dehydrogenase [Synergistaceae bacterium]|nr:UDP-N-acetylmuramate dehydrogenase [Synergistaceae bacterium]MBQ9594952.1 UDP-N-acetylmuramate dehydrogenase [Synergistaceae bacterium]MBR0203000.1 UDP-N-acetylmuramate dehydrogenase [Synergistaceae bacterium]
MNTNIDLSQLCTLGVGGVAESFAAPDSPEEVQQLIKAAKGSPVYVLGGGSNIIFPDGVIHGLVISTRNLSTITWHDDMSADIQAGYKLPVLVKTLRDKNLAGLEFAAGIPGSLGGAVSGNAGAGGHGVCELIESVLAIDSSGSFRVYNQKDFSFEYRKCSLACENIIILSVKMKFREAKPEEDENIYQKFLSLRKNQPLNFRSAGCTFKNPEGNSAGKLLDDCGCKNLRVGGAVVSDRHANFILNTGNASSSDVTGLIKICSDKVFNNTGIRLEQEIKNASPCFFALL